MNRNTVLELILIVSVASIWISGGLALPQYLDAYNTTFNTNASCGICHVNPAGGGPRTPYGMLFENQTNHATDPSAALTTIGQAPVTTPGATGAITTATSTALATSTAISTATVTSTATLVSTVPPFNATPAPTETVIPLETTPPIVSTPLPTPTPTPSTPGFGLGIFTAGLLACYFILKRRNNN